MGTVGTLAAAVLSALVVVGSQVEASPETRYVAQLRASAAAMAASAKEVAALPASGDSAALAAAGERLESAAASACRTVRTYRDATTRYGTAEEYRLMQQLLSDLDRARARFGTLVGSKLPAPTTRDRSLAEQVLRAYAPIASKKAAARLIKDERLAALLTSGGIGTIRARLRQEATSQILDRARELSLRATGIAISLDVPLAKQARAQADQAALNWLAKTAFKSSPNAFVVQLVGKPLVRFLRNELKTALRDYKHVVARTKRTTTGFANREAELKRLAGNAGTARLATVERALANAQRALDAASYLKSDLRKQGRGDLQELLRQGEAKLRAAIRSTRAAFLLDSPLARADLRGAADDACKTRGEIADLRKAIPAGGGGGGCTASLRVDKGKPGVTGTFTLVLKPNSALGGKPVQPFVTANVSGAGGDEQHVPVIFKLWLHEKGSDATFVGIGDPRGLDFNTDSAAGRHTPERIEGMFVGTTGQQVRANSPFRIRLFLTAFDEQKRSVWTELVGTCTVG